MRVEIAEAMSALFAERGFDSVTVEEAAGEVGISRATFFRYFGSKEDAVLATLEGPSVDFGSVLANLTPEPGENTWQLLSRAFVDALAFIDDASDHERARLRMIQGTPSLRARLADRRFAHEDALTEALAPHGVPSGAARPAVLAALAGLDLVWRRWADGDAPTLRQAIEEVFAGFDSASAPVAPSR